MRLRTKGKVLKRPAVLQSLNREDLLVVTASIDRVKNLVAPFLGNVSIREMKEGILAPIVFGYFAHELAVFLAELVEILCGEESSVDRPVIGGIAFLGDGPSLGIFRPDDIGTVIGDLDGVIGVAVLWAEAQGHKQEELGGRK